MMTRACGGWTQLYAQALGSGPAPRPIPTLIIEPPPPPIEEEVEAADDPLVQPTVVQVLVDGARRCSASRSHTRSRRSRAAGVSLGEPGRRRHHRRHQPVGRTSAAISHALRSALASRGWAVTQPRRQCCCVTRGAAPGVAPAAIGPDAVKAPADQIALPLDWPVARRRGAISSSPTPIAPRSSIFARWALWPVMATMLTGPRKSGRSLLAPDLRRARPAAGCSTMPRGMTRRRCSTPGTRPRTTAPACHDRRRGPAGLGGRACPTCARGWPPRRIVEIEQPDDALFGS